MNNYTAKWWTKTLSSLSQKDQSSLCRALSNYFKRIKIIFLSRMLQSLSLAPLKTRKIHRLRALYLTVNDDITLPIPYHYQPISDSP